MPPREPKRYFIKSVFGPTVQGEGSMTGEVCHFVRMSGCNMWNGRPETKADSLCPYCDTDFYGGEKLTAMQIIDRLKSLGRVSWVTLSGGEPGLQVDYELLEKLRWVAGYQVAIETNGTIDFGTNEAFIDHITCSPKVHAENLKIKTIDTLKLLYPHPFLRVEDFENVQAKHKYLQPIEDKNWKQNIEATLKKLYELEGRWKLSLQTHKYIGVQ